MLDSSDLAFEFENISRLTKKKNMNSNNNNNTLHGLGMSAYRESKTAFANDYHFQVAASIFVA